MKKILVLLSVLCLYTGVSLAGPYYDARIINPSTEKATRWISGDLIMFNTLSDTTTSFSVIDGSLTLTGTVDGIDIAAIPTTYAALGSAITFSSGTFIGSMKVVGAALFQGDVDIDGSINGNKTTLDTNLFIWNVSNGNIFAGRNYHPNRVSSYTNVAQFGHNTGVYVDYGTVAGGSGNFIHNVSTSGETAAQGAPNYSFIGAGNGNHIYSAGQTTSGNGSVICGGENNTTGNDHAFIGAGGSNTNYGDSAAIVGGASNYVYAAHNFIGAGRYNEIEESPYPAEYSSIVGGYQCVISTNSSYSGIMGGYDNLIYNSGYSSITGGDDNTIGGSSYSSIVGGLENKIGSYDGTSEGNSAKYSFIGGGYNNIISTVGVAGWTYNEGNVISGGNGNLIIGNPDGQSGEFYSATIIGGSSNTVSAPFAVAGGSLTVVSGTASVAIGGSLTVTADNAYAFGRNITNNTTDSFMIGFDAIDLHVTDSSTSVKNDLYVDGIIQGTTVQCADNSTLWLYAPNQGVVSSKCNGNGSIRWWHSAGIKLEYSGYYDKFTSYADWDIWGGTVTVKVNSVDTTYSMDSASATYRVPVVVPLPRDTEANLKTTVPIDIYIPYVDTTNNKTLISTGTLAGQFAQWEDHTAKPTGW